MSGVSALTTDASLAKTLSIGNFAWRRRQSMRKGRDNWTKHRSKFRSESIKARYEGDEAADETLMRATDLRSMASLSDSRFCHRS